MNHANNRRLHSLLTKRGMMDDKVELVLQFTNQRTKHSSAMSNDEARALINYLEGSSPKEIANVPDKLRKRVISHFREMEYNKDGKADMERIEAEMVNHWHKKLNDYSVEELRKIIGVLERKWLPWYYDQKQKQQA